MTQWLSYRHSDLLNLGLNHISGIYYQFDVEQFNLFKVLFPYLKNWDGNKHVLMFLCKLNEVMSIKHLVERLSHSNH